MQEKQPNQPWQQDAASLTDVFAQAVMRGGDALYCRASSGALSYAQAGRAVAGLAGQLGTEVRGRPVVLSLPNSIAFLIAYYAILFAGGQPALLSPAQPAALRDRLLADLDPEMVIAAEEIPNQRSLVLTDADVVALADTGPADLPQIAPEPDDIAVILFSGGTTGLPKRVPHSHRTILAKVERIDWGWPSLAGDVWLPVAPFTHVYGFLMGVTNPLVRANAIILPDRFQPDLIVDLLRRERVTLFGGGPPAIYQALMAAGNFTDGPFPDLRVCPGGGAPFPVEVHRRWQAATGLKIFEGYGMTEIAPIAVNTEAKGARPGAAGKAPPGTVIEIVDLARGNQLLPAGEAGEIRVRGPHMMTGYADNPEETAQCLRDGFVYTGDIGHLDEAGFLTITDRKKNVIFVKGYNVFPREIEEHLLTHPAVSGACVVGREDTRAGALPVAYVTLRSPVDAVDLMAHCQAGLIDYKWPAEISVLDTLPLTPAGKVDRLALDKQANA